MKIIKNLTVTVAYTVKLENIKVPREVYENLIELYNNEFWELHIKNH